MDDEVNNNGHLIVVGADHRSSTMLLRDKLAISQSQLPTFYERLRDAGLTETLVFSTNDRTEIYAVAGTPEPPAPEIIKLLSARTGLGRGEIENQTYVLGGQDAIRHLLAVFCGLDGLVIGDYRVRDQITDAFADARRAGMVAAVLNALMARAGEVSNRISRETDIGRRPVTISAAAVQVARDIHGELLRCSGLLIGAGEMGEMLASSLLSGGLGDLVVTHPVTSRAEAVGQQLNCHVGDMDALPSLLAKADIVLTSINSRRFTLAPELIKDATVARRRKPIFLIDTGVPGDIEKSVESVEDAFLYTLDNLERVTREGRKGREAEAEKAWAIINSEAAGIILPEHAPVGVDETNGAGEEPDSLEDLRRRALAQAGGDAEEATRLLLDQLQQQDLGAAPSSKNPKRDDT